MQSDGEKAYCKPVWDFALLYIACHYAVGMEFLSQLLAVSGADTHGMLSRNIFSASEVPSGGAAGAG